MPAVVKDSKTFRDELISLDLPKNARIFTAGANSMYTNIDLDHTMQVMQNWIRNVLQFGDTYFLQVIGMT